MNTKTGASLEAFAGLCHAGFLRACDVTAALWRLASAGARREAGLIRITDHEFIEEDSELALILDVISLNKPQEPVLMVSKFENTIYLRRSKDDLYEIVGVHPEMIDAVRCAAFIVVIEMDGDKITHSYDTPNGILEDNE